MAPLWIERRGDDYLAIDTDVINGDGDGTVVWTAHLPIDPDGSPFREQLVWPQTGVVAIGAGRWVHLLAIADGSIAASFSLASDRFGHLALDDDGATLYILGWCRVIAIARHHEVRWESPEIAVDGIVWRGRDRDRLRVAAEMDPPGGWVDVELDAATGAEVARAAFVVT